MSNGFVDYILDILSDYGNIKSRRMFGGDSLYCDKIIFAIILDGDVYFKADSALADEYKTFGSFPFTYEREGKTVALSYWYVPPEVLEDNELLKDWFCKSLNVSKNKKTK